MKRSFLSAAVIIFTITVTILFYRAVVSATAASAEKCLSSVIPSLYASMITACLITESRFHISVGKIFSPVARYIFRMPPEIFSVFLISAFSGYPAGTKLLSCLNHSGDITDEEFSRFCCFCFSAGPAFVAGSSAAAVSGNISAGTIITISTILANMIIAIFSGAGHRIPEKNLSENKIEINSKVIIKAVNHASNSMLQMCTMIMAFSLIKVFVIKSGIADFTAEIISDFTNSNRYTSKTAILSFIEITNISNFKTLNSDTISVMAALFSFGGLCVMLQIFSISEGKINVVNFFICRICTALLSFVICHILCNIFLKNIVCETSTFKIHADNQPLIPSLLLIMMSVMLINYEQKNPVCKT